MIYNVEPSRKTLHGTISKHLSPILRVDSGDTVIFHTIDGRWGVDKRPAPDQDNFPTLLEREMEFDYGHALSGPVYINTAEPGDVLEIAINEVVPSDWGWSQVGNTILNHDPRVGVPEGKSLFFTWDIDNEKKVCSNHAGFSLPITPFMGVMCVAPDVDGYLSTYFPYKFGGNLDCRELVAGSKLYLPVMTQGALFSTGDGHAAQGDGEVCGTAVECPMQRVSLTFTLHKDRMLEGPRALTPSGWITFGFGEDLTDAAYDAINEMVNLIMQKLGCERLAALQLASMAVDLRVTQMVNTVRGVHAILFKERVCHSCKAWEAL